MDIPIKLTSDHLIYQPSAHDSHIEMLMFRKHEVRLGMRPERGERYELRLEGVSYLRGDDLREGNIVDGIELTVGRPADETVTRSLIEGPHPSAAQTYHDAHEAFVAKTLAAIASGDRTLVRIDAAYGLGLLALCDKVTAWKLES
ncbi:MAG: hypothetical protein Q8J89_03180 [Caulobacter sp.]|nr:hypothetical protein [Caulobacter sp.]